MITCSLSVPASGADHGSTGLQGCGGVTVTVPSHHRRLRLATGPRRTVALVTAVSSATLLIRQCAPAPVAYRQKMSAAAAGPEPRRTAASPRPDLAGRGPGRAAAGARHPRAELGAARRPAGSVRRRPARQRPVDRAGPGAVRRAAGQPPPRSGSPVAARARRRVLHHRLSRSRGQRRRRRRAAAYRSRAAALPVRRLLPGPRRAGEPAAGRRDRRAARPRRRGGRADRRRPAQGLRSSGTARDPADLDDRLAPAARGRPGVLGCTGGQARPGHPVAAGLPGGGQLRRRLGRITRPPPAR